LGKLAPERGIILQGQDPASRSEQLINPLARTILWRHVPSARCFGSICNQKIAEGSIGYSNFPDVQGLVSDRLKTSISIAERREAGINQKTLPRHSHA